MENIEYLDLPEIIELNQYGGNFQAYIEDIYNYFKEDFIKKQPSFRGQKLRLKRYPLFKEKEATFWHMTSEGENEDERIPDLRRLERIKWPAYIINNSEHPYLKVWENNRGNKTNILIFHEREDYLVVLRRGNGYIIPWTAYIVTYRARREKLLKEYQDYIKSKER